MCKDIKNPFENMVDIDNFQSTNDMEMLDKLLHQKSTLLTKTSTLDILKKKLKDFNNLEILNKKLCYVNLIYDDNSVLTIHTTLKKSILAQYYVSTKEGFLFDVDRYKFIKIDNMCQEITISDSDTYHNDIVVQFANMFV